MKLAEKILKIYEEIKITKTPIGTSASFIYTDEEDYQKQIAELRKLHDFNDEDVITIKTMSGKNSAVVPLKEENISEEDAEKKLAEIQKIVDEKSMGKVSGKKIDLTTASLMLQVIDNLKEENKKKFLSLPIEKMIDVTFKLMK